MRPLYAAALGALIAMATPAFATDPLPPACDVLSALPPGSLSTQPLDLQTVQNHENSFALMSMCSALDGDDLPVATLLLRQSISGTAPPLAETQRDEMIAELTTTFGQAPLSQQPDIGEAALWVADIKQMMVWYRDGRVLLIVSAGDKTRANDIARAIVAHYP